jgi:hypothetical protein
MHALVGRQGAKHEQDERPLQDVVFLGRHLGDAQLT